MNGVGVGEALGAAVMRMKGKPPVPACAEGD
jgi:hypothetical protein